MSLLIRPIKDVDATGCGKVGYEAHMTISSKHGYPSEQPSEEYAIELIRSLLGNPNSHGFLAERQGDILGSIFLHKFPPSPVPVIGPLTVHPSAEGGIDRMLMDTTLTQVHRAKRRLCSGKISAIAKSYSFLCTLYEIWIHAS